MLTKKENLEAVEKFAENLEVEGRSLWQDARIRFMRNKAANGELVHSYIDDPCGNLPANVGTLHI